MAFNMDITQQGKIGTSEISAVNSYSGSMEVQINEDIAVGNDRAVSCSLDISQVQALMILADGALTLETNSSSAPTNTIAIQAGKPYLWRLADYVACLITSDVTSIFLSNAGSVSVNFKLAAILDATP